MKDIVCLYKHTEAYDWQLHAGLWVIIQGRESEKDTVVRV